ncbi:MAG: TIGR01841 family phasin [Burkholderiales bacterium]
MLNTQLAATNKANFEALMSLTAKAFEGVEQLTVLNLQTAKGGLAEVKETGVAVLSARDAQTLLALQAGVLQPAAEKATAYGKQVYRIVADIKAEIEKVAAEQTAAAQASFGALIEAAGKNAPAGSSDGIALIKSAMATANTAFESLRKAGAQAVETAEANYASVAKGASKAKRR